MAEKVKGTQTAKLVAECAAAVRQKLKAVPAKEQSPEQKAAAIQAAWDEIPTAAVVDAFLSDVTATLNGG